MILNIKVVNPFLKPRIRWARVVFVTLTVLLVFNVFFAFERKLHLWHTTHERLKKAKEELAYLQAENIRLKKEKEALYEPEKIESLAREKLGLTKPDEIAVKIINTKRVPSEAASLQGKGAHSSKRLWKKMKEEWPLKWLLK